MTAKDSASSRFIEIGPARAELFSTSTPLAIFVVRGDGFALPDGAGAPKGQLSQATAAILAAADSFSHPVNDFGTDPDGFGTG